jgi:muconate cycloisomerase
MRIVGVEIWTVVVPVLPGRVNSPEFGAATWPEMPKHVLRLQTDDGVYGLGETSRGCPREAVEAGAEALIGLDPLSLPLQDLPLVRDEERRHGPRTGYEGLYGPGRSSPAYDAFEMAVFDLIGRALGVPAHWLLGGAVRDRILADYWIGQQMPEDAARNARLGAERGFHGIKMKCAIDDPWEERIQAILDVAGPDFKITIDPNERFYRPVEAIGLARRLARFPNIAMYESPVPQRNLEWYRQIRAAIDVPLALHLGDARSVVQAVSVEACDYYNLGGGMVDFCRCAAIVAAAGTLCWHGSGVDLGIREHSMLHAAACARNCALPSDFVGSWVREDDLIVEPIQFEDGYALVPEKPGLGCELDMNAVEQYLVADG